jgi:2-polyprenyl-3-methyl-5-hydroxy-6-metoxy-1,4-benzoquinol methylase
MIEHLDNTRHALRQIKSLLKDEGIVFIPTLNASKLYPPTKILFTEEMAMFTDGAYDDMGHITPLTS